MDQPNQNLVPQRSDLSVANKISLTVSQQTLAVQMHLTSLNAKSEPESELVAEFDRSFSSEPTEALEWAFKAWRDKSQFFPAISDIRQLLKDWHRGEREQQAIRDSLRDRMATEEARAAGMVPDLKDVVEQLREIAKMPEPVFMQRQRKFEQRAATVNYATPAIVMTPEQIMKRVEWERSNPKVQAEVSRYEQAVRSVHTPDDPATYGNSE